jgi:hypothetical protein
LDSLQHGLRARSMVGNTMTETDAERAKRIYQQAILTNGQTDLLAGIIEGFRSVKEPSPEDMSYLSDSNIEWCLAHYLREYAKRNRKKAMACWSDLGVKFLYNVEEFEEELPQFFKAEVHRSSP